MLGREDTASTAQSRTVLGNGSESLTIGPRRNICCAAMVQHRLKISVTLLKQQVYLIIAEGNSPGASSRNFLYLEVFSAGS